MSGKNLWFKIDEFEQKKLEKNKKKSENLKVAGNYPNI
jgi:hypothetical protein